MAGEDEQRAGVMPAQALGAKPWLMLALGLLAQTATSMLTSTPAFLIPELHTHRGIPLATAGLLASTTTIFRPDRRAVFCHAVHNALSMRADYAAAGPQKPACLARLTVPSWRRAFRRDR